MPPIFSLSLSFGVVVTPGLMDRELEGFFSSGCFLFQLWGCPASALAVAGKGGSVLWAHPFFGTFAWCLFKSLLFPSYTTRCRYDVPDVLASGSGLAASACSCACRRCLRIALVPGADFPFVSSLWESRLMGQRLVIVSSPPERMCLIHSVSVECSRFCAVSTGELAFLPPLDL